MCIIAAQSTQFMTIINGKWSTIKLMTIAGRCAFMKIIYSLYIGIRKTKVHIIRMMCLCIIVQIRLLGYEMAKSFLKAPAFPTGATSGSKMLEVDALFIMRWKRWNVFAIKLEHRIFVCGSLKISIVR